MDGGQFGAAVAITGAAQALAGTTATITFASSVGHARGARWIVVATGGTVNLIVSPGVREHTMCSSSGTCDPSSGVCACNSISTGAVRTFAIACVVGGSVTCVRADTGEACEIAVTPKPDIPYAAFELKQWEVRAGPWVVRATNRVVLCSLCFAQPDFMGMLVNISTVQAPSVAYNFISAAAGPKTTAWTLNSNGYIDSQGGAQFLGGLSAPSAVLSAGETISAGGLVVYGPDAVNTGGFAVLNGSTFVTSTGSGVVASFSSENSAFAGSVVSLNATRAASSAFR